MSGMNNNDRLGQAATYQAVIIALVAGAILVIALGSIIWRRRQRRAFLARVHARTLARHEGLDGSGGGGGGGRWNWVEMTDGRVIAMRQRDGNAKRGKEVGVQPVVWDAGLGNKSAECYPPVDWDQDDEEEDSLHEKEDFLSKEDGNEVCVDGTFGDSWRPFSASIYDHPTRHPPSDRTQAKPSISTQNVQLSVLIAMPIPYNIPSASSSQSSISYTKPPYLSHNYPVQHQLVDVDYLPLLEIGSTDAKVRIEEVDMSSWTEVTKDIDERRQRHEEFARRHPR